jgi:histidine triad (HIT) family protein
MTAAGEAPCHKIWEDDNHLAFLSIFPNAAGVSVVITKEHYPSHAFELPDGVLMALMLAAKKVALLLDRKLDDVGRTGAVLEGFEIDHVHVKLYPLHGTKMDGWRPVPSSVDKYFEKYEGYISSHNWRRTDDEELRRLAALISG